MIREMAIVAVFLQTFTNIATPGKMNKSLFITGIPLNYIRIVGREDQFLLIPTQLVNRSKKKEKKKRKTLAGNNVGNKNK